MSIVFISHTSKADKQPSIDSHYCFRSIFNVTTSLPVLASWHLSWFHGHIAIIMASLSELVLQCHCQHQHHGVITGRLN